MSKVHLIIPDPHAHPQHNNDRADWVGKLICDLRPDVVVSMGDQWDMPSLASYDKGKRDFHGRTYKADIDAGREFSDRLFAPIRRLKKKKPRCVYIEGNHEQRIERALDLSPELVGTVSFKDLDLAHDYQDVVRYEGNTPGTIEIDGINYAHFFISGIMGRPLGGEHPAYSLVSKQFVSCTAAHSHLLDYCVRRGVHNRTVMGFVSGCLVDYQPDWAGQAYRLWVQGVGVKRHVENGVYDLQWISLKALEKEYGNGQG